MVKSLKTYRMIEPFHLEKTFKIEKPVSQSVEAQFSHSNAALEVCYHSGHVQKRALNSHFKNVYCLFQSIAV